MLQNLEEAIVVCQENIITYKNEKFDQLIKRLNKNIQTENEILQLKFLEVYRKSEDVHESERTKTKLSSDNPNLRFYSLSNILGKTQKFLNDKIFEIDLSKRINEGDPIF